MHSLEQKIVSGDYIYDRELSAKVVLVRNIMKLRKLRRKQGRRAELPVLSIDQHEEICQVAEALGIKHFRKLIDFKLIEINTD